MKQLRKLLLAVILSLSFGSMAYATETGQAETSGDTIYLSDLDWVTDQSSAGYGELKKDTNINGDLISLLVNDQQTTFEKGLFGHATSTIVFDLEEYTDTHPRFLAKAGVDRSQGDKGSITITVSGSNDLNTWTELCTSGTPELTGGSNAFDIDVSLTGYRYLKLYADKGEHDGNDHAAYADARLVTSDWQEEADPLITEKGVYLSDLGTLAGSSVGYGTLKKDTGIETEKISLQVEGVQVYYDKGLGAHATSTLLFNIGKYKDTHSRFIAKVGVDASRGSGGSVIFTISGSTDKTNWVELFNSGEEVMRGNTDAKSVDVDVSAYTYLKLYADETEDGDGTDHAVYADARLVSTDYDMSSEYWSGVQQVEEYDAVLSAKDADYNYANNLQMILEREFVDRMGFMNIQSYIKKDDTMEETLNWLLEEENLQLFIEAGDVERPELTLEAIDLLYQERGEHLSVVQIEHELYKKMMIALAVAYGGDAPAKSMEFWSAMGSYDVLARYDSMKELYDNGVFLYPELFRNYEMELMRATMNDYIVEEELDWITGFPKDKFAPENSPKNEDGTYRELYTEDTYKSKLGPYDYIPYIMDVSYTIDSLYSDENREKYTADYRMGYATNEDGNRVDAPQGYSLNKYGVPYGYDKNADGSILTDSNGNPVKTPRNWMVIEAGGICWNMSRFSQSMNKGYGIATYGIFQPIHEALFTYSENEDGDGIWSIKNDVFGWGKTYTDWGGIMIYRMPFGWGSHTAYSHTEGEEASSGTYILLAQAALNDYEDYQKSFYYTLLADSYDSAEEKEAVYQKALEALDINLDSYLGLMELYKADTSMTEEEWLAFSQEIINAYTYYPTVMSDLLAPIAEELTGQNAATLQVKRNAALLAAKRATEAESIQYAACRDIAGVLLGEEEGEFATFSFDGERAGQIVLSDRYANFDFQVRYRLGGDASEWIPVTFTPEDAKIIILSEEELASITAENDIQLVVSGAEDDIHVIDILPGTESTVSDIYVNDREDKFIGNISNLEYSLDNGVTWQDYTSQLFTGNVTVKYRKKAHGVYLSGEIYTATFTEAEGGLTKSYVPIDQISFVHAGSFQPGYSPEYMIDGKHDTVWHTTWGVQETDKSFVIEFATKKYFAGFAYDPEGANGRIQDVEVYISTDNENWEMVGAAAGWENNTETKELILAADKVKPAKYVKIVVLHTYGNSQGEVDYYVSGKAFHYYEDKYKIQGETTVTYSTQEWTRQNVTATLELDEMCTSTEALTHTFTENGSHDFHYTDGLGQERTATATVTWIDKTAPTAEVEYSTTEPTRFDVVATLGNFSEENVTVLNAEAPYILTFTENGEFVYELEDAVGNRGEVAVRVTWIDKTAPTAEIEYENTGDKVIARVVNTSEAVIFGADNGVYEFTAPGEYTFVFTDLVGNEATLTARIDKYPSDLAGGMGEVREEDMPPNGSIPEGLWMTEIADQTYTGKAIKPEVRVYNHTTLLREKTDYTVTYKYNTAAGKKTDYQAPVVIVTGKGNYKDKAEQKFTILKKDIGGEEFLALDTAAVANGKVQKAKPVIKWGNKKLGKKDYTVSYWSGNKYVREEAFGGYSSPGEYKIKLEGQGNFEGEKEITFTLTANKDFLISKAKIGKIADVMLKNGEVSLEGKLSVTLGGYLLREGKDYQITKYYHDVQTGKATVVIAGMDKYVGEKEASFKITSSLKQGALIPAKGVSFHSIYTGKPITYTTEQYAFKVNGVTLEEGKDYTVVYTKNSNAGTATMELKGQGWYSGSYKKTFTIGKKNLRDKDVEVEVAEVSYAKGGALPQVVVTYNGQILREKLDYTLSYQNHKNAGTGMVVIKGKGNYEDVRTETFKINKKDLNDVIFSADVVHKSKPGNYKPKLKLTDLDGKTLSAGKDYNKDTIMYEYYDSKQEKFVPANESMVYSVGSRFRITIQAAGSNYTGPLVKEYRLVQNDISKARVAKITKDYTGEAVELTDTDLRGKVNVGGWILVPGEDFKVVEGSYRKNISKGTATVAIEAINGDGNYKFGGTKNVTFKIDSQKVTDLQNYLAGLFGK